MASQITSLTVVYSTVYSDADQIKHQSSASLAFVWGIPRTNGQWRGKCLHLMTLSCYFTDTLVVTDFYCRWNQTRNSRAIIQRQFASQVIKKWTKINHVPIHIRDSHSLVLLAMLVLMQSHVDEAPSSCSEIWKTTSVVFDSDADFFLDYNSCLLDMTI